MVKIELTIYSTSGEMFDVGQVEVQVEGKKKSKN